MKVQILSSAEDLAETAAELFVAQRGLFTVALAGGSTPKLLYRLLADPNKPFRERVSWPDIHFFWSDERHVPPDDPQSNYRMANESMLSRVPVSEHKVHRIKSEYPNAAEAAQEYEEEISKFIPLDLILLGLGTDGHTASIFPGAEVLHEREKLVAASYVEKLKSDRITMTLPLINNAASVVFLVSGAEKAEIVKEVLQGPARYPAQEVQPINGELVWLLDREAASKL